MALQQLHELPQGVAELAVVTDLSCVLQQRCQPAPDEVDFQVLGFQLLQDLIQGLPVRVFYAGEQRVFLVVVMQGERRYEFMPQLPGVYSEITADSLQFYLFNQLCQAFTQVQEVGVVIPDHIQCIAEVRGGFGITLELLHG
jgi:hypothetical protein